MSSWQSRLASIDNLISQKLIDNSINLAGGLTDVIQINEDLNDVQDVNSYTVNALNVVSIMFPPMLNIPTWRFVNQGSQPPISANDEKKNEPIICQAPIATAIDQGSILLKFLLNTQSDAPWCLALRVADVYMNFGAWAAINKNLILTYYDTPINPTLLGWLNTFATRRGILGF